MWRTFDYICLCGVSIFDEVVEVQLVGNDIIILDTVACPTCGKPMHKKIPLSNVQFGDSFFAGMGWPRRREVTWSDENGKQHVKNITHAPMSTDTNAEK